MGMRMKWSNCTMKFGGLIIILLHFSAEVFLAHGQSPESSGFIFIDCGKPDSYRDQITGITYFSDVKFTDTGLNRQVSDAYFAGLAVRYKTVRYFPEGNRNCYYFDTIALGMKYIIRATFLYGNYDFQNNMPQFDLYLDANLWRTIKITDPAQYHLNELVAEATADHISVCLVNTGRGTPFISGLDLRPMMNASLYPMVTASRSLVLLNRLNLGGSGDIRYPADPFDRIWIDSVTQTLWKNISTNSAIKNVTNDQFEVPPLVMQTAVSPVNSTKLELILTPVSGDLNESFAVMYFSELQSLSKNASRQFFVLFNDILLNDAKPLAPEFLITDSIYNMNPSTGFNITLAQTSDSTLPPILNAVEVYTAMRNTNIASDNGDVDAMMAIKMWHQVQKNWYGDPCSPKIYIWQGLNCTPDASGTPRITAINLSSSGLTGEMSTYFANLSSIQYLDLSHNNLTGSIPVGLADLPSLKLLDLTDNQLNGSVPSALLARSQNGSLILRTEGNHICFNCEPKNSSREKKRVPVLTIIIASIVPPVIIFFLAAITIYILRRRYVTRTVTRTGTAGRLQNEGTLQFENKKFTYMELERITNNFETILGNGGFGTVYYGHLEDGTEVAVKMQSHASTHGNTEFLAEIQHLTRVHHKNLVSMVGYCKDGDHLALVYEYMCKGTLKKYLKGSSRIIAPLSWNQRLQIALGAAQGLEYLHTGCKPPLIHRDVKSENILLNERLEAKISDFGLSKAFQNDSKTHVSTRVVGTPGYLDPEYYIKNKLTKKSDVFSYGVVLLELITGQPPILDDAEGSHIIEWVRKRLARGNIEDVVDSRLHQDYDVNSSWKVAVLGLECVAQSSHERPSITEVVIRLKETLELYNGDEGTQFQRNLSGEKSNEESSEISQIDTHEIQEVTGVWVKDGPSVR